jgi:hypothetical protein
MTQGTDETLLNNDLNIPDLPELGLRNSKTIDIDSRNNTHNLTTAHNSPRDQNFQNYMKALEIPSVGDITNTSITAAHMRQGTTTRLGSGLDTTFFKKATPAIPQSLLQPALKPGKNFKWRNEDIK